MQQAMESTSPQTSAFRWSRVLTMVGKARQKGLFVLDLARWYTQD